MADILTFPIKDEPGLLARVKARLANVAEAKPAPYELTPSQKEAMAEGELAHWWIRHAENGVASAKLVSILEVKAMIEGRKQG